MNGKRILAGALSLLMVYSAAGVYGNVFAETDQPALTEDGDAKVIVKELTKDTVAYRIFSDGSMLIKGSGVLTDIFSEDDVKDVTKLIIEDENEDNRISIAPNALNKFHNVEELTLPTAGSELWAEFKPEKIDPYKENGKTLHHSKIAELFDYENSTCKNEVTKCPYDDDLSDVITISNPSAWTNYGDADKKYNALLADYNLKKVTVTGGTAITDFAFYNTTIESVSIPESVTDIGRHAFMYCTYLDDCELSSNIKYIGEMAFAFTSLKSASITNPDYIIEKGAFTGCGLLKELTFANLEPGHLDYYLYENESVFRKYSFKEDRTALSIIRNIFADKVIMIDNYCVKYSFSTNDTFCNSWYNRINLEKINVLGGNQIAPYAFSSIPTLKSVTLPNTISVIGVNNFGNNENLSHIEYAGTEEEWKNTVITEGNELQTGTEIITSDITKTEPQNNENKITDFFDRNAQINTHELKMKDIPSVFINYQTEPEETLKSEEKLNDTLSCRTYESGMMVISGSGLLEDIFDEETASSVTKLVIENKSEKEKIKIADNALKKFKNIEELTLPSADKELWNDFKPQTVSENENSQTVHCSLLGYLFNSEANISFDTKLTCTYNSDTDTYSFTNDLPDNIDPDFSVMNDYKIKKITVSGGEEIADFAFYNIPVETVVLPETITVIGKSAFEKCNALKECSIPKSVSVINELAFASTSLSQAEILNPDYIVSKGIFANCKDLTSLYLENIEPGHMDLSAANKDVPEELSVVLNMFANKTDTAFENENSQTVHKYDFSTSDSSNNLQNIYVLNGEKAAAYACYGIESLKKISFASSVRLIEKYCFGCQGRDQSNTGIVLSYFDVFNDLVNYYYTVMEGNYYSYQLYYTHESEYTGDLSGNGIVDLTDLTCLSLYLMDDSSYRQLGENFSESIADINGDGKVDIADLADLKRYISKDWHTKLGANRDSSFYSNSNI